MSPSPLPLPREAKLRIPRICIVSYGRLHELASSLAKEYGGRAEMVFIERTFEDALEEVRALEDCGAVDAFVSAGASGAFLRGNMRKPLSMVRVSGFDIFRALISAREHAKRVALMTYEAVNHELDEVKQLIDLDITQRHYTSSADAHERVTELVAGGYDVIIGSSLIAELAQQLGAQGVFLYSQGSVRNAIEDAIHMAELSFEEARRRVALETMLSRLQEGVVCVDTSERVVFLNPRMAEFLDVTREAAFGKRLSQMAPALGLADTLRTGRDELEAIEVLTGRTLVVNRMAMHTDHLVTGAVLTGQDATAIRKADEAVRRRNKSKSTRSRFRLDDIHGGSEAMRHLRAQAAQMATVNSTVLIAGESGTGKEMFAQGIHNASDRRANPFVAINCATIPETLIESELFGHEEGAFSGAMRGGRTGLFEGAHLGTVFLDEITEMPFSAQARLLRVLQEREVTRIGSNEPIPIDVRFIAATNRDIRQCVEAGSFRRDLFYRLNVLRLTIPPLRERREDIAEIALSLLHSPKLASGLGLALNAAQTLSLMQALRRYHWPGNVREMENVIERIRCYRFRANGEDRGEAMFLRDIAPELFHARHTLAGENFTSENSELDVVKRRAELAQVRRVLETAGGNTALAAAKLGISRTTLWRKLKQLAKIEREKIE